MDIKKIFRKSFLLIFLMNVFWVIALTGYTLSSSETTYDPFLKNPSLIRFLKDYLLAASLLFVTGTTWISYRDIGKET